MSKSILVIDTPAKCNVCRFSDRDVDCIPEEYCKAHKDEREIINGREKPDWCPLKEVPQKYEPVSMNFERGFNSCVDEILKGD